MNTAAILTVDHEFKSLVQDLLDNTTSVVYVKDVDFHYLFVNRQFLTLFHRSRTDVVGKTDYDIFPRELAEGFRKNDRRVVEGGETVQCEEIAPQDDGAHTYLSLKFPLRDQQGSIYAMAGISTDITDRIRAQREIASLQNRQRLILESVGDGICGLDAMGRVVFLNPAAERMLQWKTDELRGTCHTQFVIPRRSSSLLSAVEPSPIAEVLQGRASTQVQGSRFRRRDNSLLPVDYTVAPIHDHSNTVGAVIAFRDTTDRLRQLETEQEIQTARRIQSLLVPQAAPAIAGFDFAAMSEPCSKACGDYFDFIPWGEDRLGIAVGDVSGHGLGAALEMVETRAILRTTMMSEISPVECLSRLNQILTDDLPDDMFVTLFLASLDTRRRILTYASAGHDALVLAGDGTITRIDSTGTALGLNRSATFSNGRPLALETGDIVLIATDGLSESVSPRNELFGRHRISDILVGERDRTAAEILEALRQGAEAFRERAPQRDDMTAVVIKVI